MKVKESWFMNDSAAILKALKPENDFFIGLDSDGCTFDTMEIKHKECFCPVFINHFNLQAVSKYAREAWEFVNLYSRTRGINRFLALLRALDLLSVREDVNRRNQKIQSMNSLRKWVQTESRLGNPALKNMIENNPEAELVALYDWSLEVNETVKRVVHNIPPFSFVKESLDKMSTSADIIVVSQTPEEALNREWKEHGIDSYVKIIAGQEMGTKTEHILYAAKGKYDDNKILMIGDAPGDYKAAKDNNSLFFPIVPGQEEESWEFFYNEGMDRFFNGTFSGQYEKELIDEFFLHLPELPDWK
jgi:phosphoglycolate phosphatase-like HAD superfamily hydrolase